MKKVFLVFILFFQIASLCSAQEPRSRNSQLADILARKVTRSPSRHTSLSLIDLGTGREVYSFHAKKVLKPASILKIISSGAVLSYFGPIHQFETVFWELSRTGKRVAELIVQGGGDPLFTIEDAWILAREIRMKGIETIGVLNYDSSLFAGSGGRVGQRAYEAGASALAFNFNSIGIEVCPTRPGDKAFVSANPWEVGVDFLGSIRTAKGRKGTPRFHVDEQSPLAGERQLAFRLAGEIRPQAACQTVYRSVESPPDYFIRTFAGLLESVGVRVERIGSQREVSSIAKRLVSHRSKTVSEILRSLNHYSNNVIAEQLLYALGRDEKHGGVHFREVGIGRVSDYLERLGFPQESFAIFDGSGLAHENKISAKMIVSVLREMNSRPEFAPDFAASLPLPGANGTLKDRTMKIAPSVLRAKTGTLTGVSSLAGYLSSPRGEKYAFAIIQNGTPSKGRAVRFEDGVVQTIADVIR